MKDKVKYEFVYPANPKGLSSTDPLARRAQEPKKLSTGTLVRHIGCFVPKRINKDSNQFVDFNNDKHKIDEFDWENGRFCI